MEELAGGFGLIEGPVWDGGLVLSDVPNGGVYRLGEDGSITTVVEHRRGIGGIALHEAGGLVVGGRNVAYKGPAAPDTVVLLGNDCVDAIIGFNDLTTDAAGRIYAGSLGASPFGPEAGKKDGYLHLVELDGSHRVLAAGIRLTNGLGFSPGGDSLYHADSGRHRIGAYEVHGGGDVGEWRDFAVVDNGIPDGLAVAEDGSLWVAAAHGGEVLHFGPSGDLRRRIACPHPMPTSVCFGGADLLDLYVVTGTAGTGRDDSGTIFRTRVDVPGLPVAPARVALSPGV